MIRRLGLWLLALLVCVPGAALAQTVDQVEFPNLGYDPTQWKFIIDGFYQGFYIFKMIAGRCGGVACSKALFYLALSAGLIGGLLFLFNPKFQRVPVMVGWVALVFLLIIGPYNSQGSTKNLFFYTFGAEGESFANAEKNSNICAKDDVDIAGGQCGVTAFMPQLMVIHTISTIHQALFYSLYRCNAYGICHLRDPISEILAESQFRGLNDTFNTSEHGYMAYEASMLQQLCHMSPADLNKLPYQASAYESIHTVYAPTNDVPMLSPARHAQLRKTSFTIRDVAGALDSGLRTLEADNAFPPLALLMAPEDYNTYRNAALQNGLEAYQANGGTDPESDYNITEMIELEENRRNDTLHKIAQDYGRIGDGVELEEFIGNFSSYAQVEDLFDDIIVDRLRLRGVEPIDRNDSSHPSMLVGSMPSEGSNSDYAYWDKTLSSRKDKSENFADYGIESQFDGLVRARFLADTRGDMPVFMAIYRPAARIVGDDEGQNVFSQGYNENNRLGLTDSPKLTGYFKYLLNRSDTDIYGRESSSGTFTRDPNEMNSMWSDTSSLFKNSIVRDCADLHDQYIQRRLFIMLANTSFGEDSVRRWLDLNSGKQAKQGFNVILGSSTKRVRVSNAYEQRYTTAYYRINGMTPDSNLSSDDIANAARARLLADMLKYNWVVDTNNRLISMMANYGSNPSVQAAVDDYQLPGAGRLLGSIGNVVAENTLGIAAQFVGTAAIIYLNFITKLIDLAMMAILMFTPLFFLMGLLIPSHAPGLLILSVMTILVLKTVPIMLMLVNICLSMIFQVLGMDARSFDFSDIANIEGAILLFAAGGLYTGIVALTMFVLFKIGDAGNLERLTNLDSAANKIGETFEKFAYAIAATAASTVGAGALGGVRGIASGAVKGFNSDANASGIKKIGDTIGGSIVGALGGGITQGTDVLTKGVGKGISQIPGLGGVGGEIGNAWLEGGVKGSEAVEHGLLHTITGQTQMSNAKHAAFDKSASERYQYEKNRAKSVVDSAEQIIQDPDMAPHQKIKAVEEAFKAMGQSGATKDHHVDTATLANHPFDNLVSKLASTGTALEIDPDNDVEAGVNRITADLMVVAKAASGDGVKVMQAGEKLIDQGNGKHVVASQMTKDFKKWITADGNSHVKEVLDKLLEDANIQVDYGQGLIYTNGTDGVVLSEEAQAALKGKS